MRGFLPCAALLLTLVYFTEHASSQEGRYELGRRLRRFELEWQSADNAGRVRSTAAMESAVSKFFALRWLDAAQQLDAAYLAVQGEPPAQSELKWALAQRMSVRPMFTDVHDETLRVEFRSFYPVEGELPNDATLQLQLNPLAPRGGYALATNDSSPPLLKTAPLPWAEFKDGWQWSVGALPEGDYVVSAYLNVSKATYEVSRATISRGAQLDDRLAALKRQQEALAASSSSTGDATLRSLWALLKSLRDGTVQEIDYPAMQLLQDCEALVAAGGRSEKVYHPGFSGEAWLTLAKGNRATVVRIRAPGKTDAPMPVLFLFHGAGGSENMFFETYGAGRAVDEAARRGWLVVAPRQGLFSGLALNCQEMLDILGEHFPIDRKVVYFLGHSMGAGQAVKQAVAAPDLPRAVVALGGGGRVAGAKLGPASWFVGAGQRDFGKRQAKSLAETLTSAGRNVQWKEYPQVEHMVVVQAALDEVFDFLDRQ